MMCYSFTLASSCLLLNIRWTCWILSVHVLYDRVWSFYLVQSHVLFRTRDTSFTICSHRWCISWFILVLLWTTRFFVVFFLRTTLFEATWHVLYWFSQLFAILNYVRSLKPILLLIYFSIILRKTWYFIDCSTLNRLVK